MRGKYLSKISIVILLYIFSQAQASVSTVLEFESPNSSNDDKYGRAVSVDGDVAVIYAKEPNDDGSLYVYRLNGLNWQYEATLTAPNSVNGNYFGRSVCVVGDTIVAGAPQCSSNRGAVCVFECNETQWGDPNILTASDTNAGDYFGWSVDFDGNKIVAGAIYDDDQKGGAYVFSRDGSGWSEDQKLTASDGNGTPDRSPYGDHFGYSVAIEGNTIVVGAQADDCGGSFNDFYGSSYIFKYSGGTWSEDTKIEASDGQDHDFFGHSVCLYNNTIVVGAHERDSGGEDKSGAVYVYEPNGASWDETILEDPNPDSYARLGCDVEIDGDRIIAGAYRTGTKAGAALLFERDGSSWSEGERLASSIPASYDEFGYSVSIDGNNVLVGAPNYYSSNHGKAYMLKLLEPVINEFRVNSYTSNNQQEPAIAIDTDSNFVVVWESRNQDGDSYGIYGQRFDLYGRRIGDEFLVNVTTSNGQSNPDVAMNANGDFVVVWNNVDGTFENIYARRYAADGQPLAGEFLVNTYTDSQRNPVVELNDNGTFVVIWDSYHGVNDWRVAGRVYNAAGNPLTSEFDISQSGSCHVGSVVMDTAGDFIVVWAKSSTYTRMRKYNANGTPKGGEFCPITDVSGYVGPSIAMDSNGNYIVTWLYHPDFQQRNVYAQRFVSDGNTIGGEFLVNTNTDGRQRGQRAAMADNGYFVIVWYGPGDGSGEGIFSQKYDSSGSPIGSEIQLNAYTNSAQKKPVVAMQTSERFITAWHSNGEDGSGYGVYAAFAPKTFLGDFTANGVVDWDDLAIFTSRWLRNEPVLDIAPAIIGDDTVNFLDFCTFAHNWLIGIE